MKNKSSNLADQLFPEVAEEQDEILNIPPDKRKLNTETYDFTVSTINISKAGLKRINAFCSCIIRNEVAFTFCTQMISALCFNVVFWTFFTVISNVRIPLF